MKNESHKQWLKNEISKAIQANDFETATIRQSQLLSIESMESAK